MDQLVTAGLAFCRGVPPLTTYLFKHALVQDAGYGTLLRGKRQQLHKRVADVLEEKWPEVAEAQPELLALHWSLAGLAEQAAAYYARAGQRAVARSAMAEATSHLSKGLALLTSLPASASRQRRELELQLALGRVLIATQGYAAPAVGEAFERARTLCEQLDRPPQIVQVLYGQWAFRLLKGPLHEARELAAEMLRRGEDTSDAAVILMGHRLCGSTCFQLGEFSDARAHLEKGLAHFDPKDRPFYMSLAAHDAKVTMLAYHSANLTYLGYLDQAQLGSKAAVEEARKLGHAFNLAHALHLSCLADFATLAGEHLLARADAIIALSEEHGLPFLRAAATIWRGLALAEIGHTADGIAQIETGLAQYVATGAVQFVPFILTVLADAEGKAKQRDRALGHLLEAERSPRAD